MDGINKKIDPGSPVQENIYKMDDSKRKNLGISVLPKSLEESLSALKSDSNYLDLCFHNDLIDTYIDVKSAEIAEIGVDKSKINEFLFYYDT